MRPLHARLVAVLSVVGAAFPSAAAAHSTVQVYGAEISYASEDAVSDNRLTVRETATDIVFADPEADAGIQSSDPRCRAASFDAVVTELRCRKSGLSHVSLDLGPNEDTARVTLGAQWTLVLASGGPGRDTISVVGPGKGILSGDQGSDSVSGGDGDDHIRGADGDDSLTGGSGHDVLDGGLGVDELDGGSGDDSLSDADGLSDGLACGDGTDSARADTRDRVGPDCERVERASVEPPPGYEGSAGDRTPPTVRVGGATVQRVGPRRRMIRLAVTSTERGTVSASGFVTAGGLNHPVESRSRTIAVGGGGVRVALRLSRAAVRAAMRDLRRGRRPRARLRVAATDAAGNTAVSRTFRVRLRR